MADLVHRSTDAFGRIGTRRNGAAILAVAGTVLVVATAQPSPLGIVLGLGLLADFAARSDTVLLSPSTALLAGVAPAAPAASGALALLLAAGRWFRSGGRIPYGALFGAASLVASAVAASFVSPAPLSGVVALAAAYLLQIGGEAAAPRLLKRCDPFESRAFFSEAGREILARALVAGIAAGVVAHGSTIYLLVFAVPLGYLAAAERARGRRRRDRKAMIQALSGMLQYAHPYTLGHMQRVGEMAERVGERMGLGARHREKLAEAALLHDIGKLAIDEDILESPRRLTEAEWAQVKTHSALGAEILTASDPRDPAIAWVRHHHERVDGTGYPDRISGMEIPVESRIIAVIDAYDAMTGTRFDDSIRRYKAPVNSAEARLELRRCAGTQFDPAVVEAFERMLEEDLV